MTINIKEYQLTTRAVGTGLVDDFLPIQSAINVVAQSGGGTVFLPGGRYSVSRPLSWTAQDVRLAGDGAAIIAPTAGFLGAAVIAIGYPTATLQPAYRAGLSNITVDLSACVEPDLIGVELTQTWSATINGLRIVSTNGRAAAIQTAFQMNGGALSTNAPLTNWAANNDIYSLQVAGSFQYSVRHVSGGQGGVVNATNYFGGALFGNAANKTGTVGVQLDIGSGDSTRFFGTALEDFDIGVYVGSQNNGPIDVRIEGCNTPYAAAPGITFTVPALAVKP